MNVDRPLVYSRRPAPVTTGDPCDAECRNPASDDTQPTNDLRPAAPAPQRQPRSASPAAPAPRRPGPAAGPAAARPSGGRYSCRVRLEQLSAEHLEAVLEFETVNREYF